VQLGDVGVMLTVVRMVVPIAMVTDCVDGEMNFGVRAVDDVAIVFVLIRTVTCAVAPAGAMVLALVGCEAGTLDEPPPPPPHAARNSAAVTARIEA
jgi:hypothetical protein